MSSLDLSDNDDLVLPPQGPDAKISETYDGWGADPVEFAEPNTSASGSGHPEFAPSKPSDFDPEAHPKTDTVSEMQPKEYGWGQAHERESQTAHIGRARGLVDVAHAEIPVDGPNIESENLATDGGPAAKDILERTLANSPLADEPISDLHEVDRGNINGVYRVELVDGQIGFLKPESEEAANLTLDEPLRSDIPASSEWRREVAASVFDRAVGFGVVPETVVRYERELGFENASLQAEAPGEGLAYESYSSADFDRVAALDYVLGNSDRHHENFRTSTDGRPAATDNGLVLPEGDRDGIRSQWVADRLGKALDPDVVRELNSVDTKQLSQDWRNLGISQVAIDGALSRLKEVQGGVLSGSAWHGDIYDGSLYWNRVRGRI